MTDSRSFETCLGLQATWHACGRLYLSQCMMNALDTPTQGQYSTVANILHDMVVLLPAAAVEQRQQGRAAYLH